MDTSEKYIKMCRKFLGFQDHKAQEGDYYVLPNRVVFIVASYCLRIDNDSKSYLAIPKKMRPSEILGKPDFDSPLFNDTRKEFEKFPLICWVWLPTQHQLQKLAAQMPTWVDTRPINVLCRFWNWWKNSDWFYCSDDTSMEQLWLAFVMFEKYNKEWDNEKWIEFSPDIKE